MSSLKSLTAIPLTCVILFFPFFSYLGIKSLRSSQMVVHATQIYFPVGVWSPLQLNNFKTTSGWLILLRNNHTYFPHPHPTVCTTHNFCHFSGLRQLATAFQLHISQLLHHPDCKGPVSIFLFLPLIVLSFAFNLRGNYSPQNITESKENLFFGHFNINSFVLLMSFGLWEVKQFLITSFQVSNKWDNT